MMGHEPDATIRLDDGESAPVWNLQITTARPDSERARHWLTGQPLEGVYLREVKRPLAAGMREITLSIKVDTSELQQFAAAMARLAEGYVEGDAQ